MNDYFWAKTTQDDKPGKSVLSHMRDVRAVADILLRTKEQLLLLYAIKPDLMAAFAGLHDIGKISPGFQSKCVEWLRQNDLEETARNNAWDTLETDHAKISQFTVQNMLVRNKMRNDSAEIWAALLGAHHGRLQRLGVVPRGCGTDDMWESKREAIAQNLLGTIPLPNFPIDSSWPLAWWMAGLVSVADWIASNEAYFSPDQIETTPEESMNKADEALSIIGFKNSGLRAGLSFGDIFKDKSGFPFKPNDLQSQAGTEIKEPGLYIIEAPMGMGKTEAALWSAYRLMCKKKASGIYFALPTQITSNRIYTRIQDFLGKILLSPMSARLIHANSWLFDSIAVPDIRPAVDSESESAQEAKDWFASKKRTLLAPFGVGTIDQALMSVIAVKHFFVRQFALAGKVVILDEVHSYDLYTGTLIKTLCDRLLPLGCTVIVLSATLTGDIKKRFIDTVAGGDGEYPIITGQSYTGGKSLSVSIEKPEAKNVHVYFKNEEESIENAIRKARGGACILWVCDTVNRAQRMYRYVKDKIGGVLEIGLLHSRFPLFRRQELEDYWIEKLGKDGKNRSGCILFSAQVVEQSVDLDADFMVSELAPTDTLLQRMGRLWRHDRGQRSCANQEFYIIAEKATFDEFRAASANEIKKMLGSKARVYAPYVLLRSLEVWHSLDKKTIKTPEDIRDLLKNTYECRDDDPEGWQRLARAIEGEKFALRSSAEFEANVWNPLLSDDEGTAKTRVNNYPTTQMVLFKQKQGKTFTLLNDEVVTVGHGDDLNVKKAIHRNIVKVPADCFSSKPGNKDITALLRGDWQLGVVGVGEEVSCKRLKAGIRLQYTHDKGLEIIQDIRKEEVNDEPCD